MSDKNLLNVKDLYVDVEDKEILHGVNLSIGKGETHVLMGPNGTGKSTLGYALMGNPRYTVKSGYGLMVRILLMNQLMRELKQECSYHSRTHLKFRVLHSVHL